MGEKRIVVPEGMLKAAIVSYNNSTSKHGYKYVVDAYVMIDTLESVLLWMDEILEKEQHPIKIKVNGLTETWVDGWVSAIKQVRGMFLAPDPEVPEAVRGLLWDSEHNQPSGTIIHIFASDLKTRILEAYRRGKESREK